MRRFATAGSAVQHRYICLPCQQRLFRANCTIVPQPRIEYRRSFSLRASLLSQNTDGESKGNISVSDAAPEEADSEPGQEAKDEQPQDEGGGMSQPTKKRKKKAEKLQAETSEETKVDDATAAKETSPSKTKSAKKGESKSGTGKAKIPTRSERLSAKRSKKQQLKGEKKKANEKGDDTGGSLVKTLATDVGIVRARIKRLRTKLEQHRAKKNVGPTYRFLADNHGKLRLRVQRLEEEVLGALSNKSAAGPRQARTLNNLKTLLPTLMKTLDEAQPADSDLAAADKTASYRREWRAVSNLRQASRLKELIGMVNALSSGSLESDPTVSNQPENERKGTDLQALMDELPKTASLDNSVVNEPAVGELRKTLRAVFPEIESSDEIHVLRMFKEHLEARSTNPTLANAEPLAGMSLAEAVKKTPYRSARSRNHSEGISGVEIDTPDLSMDVRSKDLKSLKKDLIKSRDFALEPIDVEQPPVRGLEYGLDRVLFNPGVSVLQDTRSKVYNFDPYLEHIMPVGEFNFDLLSGFTTSSKDDNLQRIAKEQSKRYLGSSSSMTGILSQFHFLLSRFRDITLDTTSRSFDMSSFHLQHTSITKGPAAVLLRWKEDREIYAIDAQKEFDEMNVLSMLGHSLERLLTLPTDDYEKFRRDEAGQATQEKANEPESYHYTGFGDLLMRSQLDAYDSRLPGTGMFDLKTRAVLPVRMDVSEHLANRDYEIRFQHGKFESFEREYVDMVRATMLKYMLQVRIGRMDGIFVAYHNTQRIFGFQYVPVEELDLALHGQRDRSLGDEEFKLSLKLMNEVLNRATERFPKQTLQVHFSTSGGKTRTKMHVFVEPMSEADADELQSQNAKRNEAITQEILAARAPSYDQQSRRIFPLQEDLKQQATKKTEASAEEIETGANAVASDGEDPSSVAENADDTSPDSELSTSDEILVEQNSSPSEESESSTENGYDADTNFLDGVDGDKAAIIAQSKAPLLAMQLTVENYVDGKPVTAPGFMQKPEGPLDRYEDISTKFSSKSSDDWSLLYDFREIKDSQRAWELYLHCKKQRRNLIDYERDKSGLQSIHRALKPYVDNGRRHRLERDEQEAGKEKVFLGDTPRRQV